MSQNSYLREFCALLSQIVFLADLTVLRLNSNVLNETSKNSYIFELTILRLISTVWPKNVEISYLSDFSAQVSQIVLLADLTVLRLITTL